MRIIFWKDFRHQPALEGINACIGVYMHEFENREKDLLHVYESSVYAYIGETFIYKRMFMQEIPVVTL